MQHGMTLTPDLSVPPPFTGITGVCHQASLHAVFFLPCCSAPLTVPYSLRSDIVMFPALLFLLRFALAVWFLSVSV